jgi:TolB-like protein/class 3 adenylate cyclase/Tfp pilus assembly protein PilF
LTKVAEPERRLIAIFAADVEGYSRLMAVDEVGTLSALTQRRAILDGLIASHRGRIANTAGDSVLAEFASTVDAVRCAVEAQATLADANAGASPERHINFRIGIHVGDVMVRNGDLFGDGVNIAARLQTLASAGSVCISSVAHDQVRKILPFEFADLGAQQVKNIEEPVRAFALSAKGGSTKVDYAPASVPLALPDKPSIAVLPFQNMSGDAEQEYFADGMVEDIITGLSHSKSLFVIARNSSFTYKGKVVDIKRVGRDLGVRYVLEGSVRKASKRVRITGQLIDATTGVHLWANRFDGLLEDIFDLQDRVATSVIGAILPQLERAEIERAKKKPTGSLQAYDYYLRGVACSYQYTFEANCEMLELTAAANLIDCQFALPYALGAFAFTQRKAFGWITDLASEISEVRRLAERALELDKNDARVLAQAGFALGYVVEEVEKAAVLIKRAVQLDPNLVLARLWLGWTNVYLGDREGAVEQVEAAMRLDPLDPRSYTALTIKAYAHFFGGRIEEALSLAANAVGQQPNYISALRLLMACHAMAGRMSEARQVCERVMRIDPRQRISVSNKRAPFLDEDKEKLAQAFRLAGMPD